VINSVVREWASPNHERLSEGDPESVGQLWNNCQLANRFSSAEIVCTDNKLRPEVLSLQHDVRKIVLSTMPCLQCTHARNGSGKDNHSSP
jgi:hypothetical protein